MFRIVQSSSAQGAKHYFTASDYYVEGTQELAGMWRGKAGVRLGLHGEVGQREWSALCENRNPETGRVLTARQKENRRVGYDFNFHVPKSVSLLYALMQDEQILDAFREAVNETMEEVEADAQARVRKGGRDEDRTTGNLVWGEFVHFTSRPVNGIPDPHLHAHCFVLNTTWDDEESRWKAGQFGSIKRDSPYYEAVFHSRLTEKIESLGFSVDRTKKGWEIAGMSLDMLRKFSRRTALIEELAKLKDIKDAKEKGQLGAKTREKKAKTLSMSELQEEWRSRLTDAEATVLARVAKHEHSTKRPVSAKLTEHSR